MTTQNISLAFGADNVGVKQSGTNRSTGEKSGFDSVIGSKTSGVQNDKTAKVTGDTKASCKVNVINNGSSAINNDNAVVNDIEAKDIDYINVYMEDGKLQVQLAGDSVDGDMAFVDIDSFLDELKSMIADILGVSEEEIEEVLEQNGMTMLDVLVPQNLQELFVKVEGMEDFSDILTDDNANTLWMQLSESVADFDIQLQQDVHINPEQLAGIIESAMQQDENAGGDSQTDKLVDSHDVADDVVINNVSESEEPSVIINNETESAGEGTADKGDRNFAGQGTEYDKSSDNVREENVFDTGNDVAEGKAGESLFTQFMDRVEAAVNHDTPQAVENLQQMREIANQVIEGVRINVRPDTSGFEIQLNPEHLGKVNVVVQMREGVAVANFAVKDEMARVALENQMQSLKDTFENQGLKVESIEVTVSDFSFRQNDNSWSEENQGRDGNRRRFRSDEELERNGDFVIGSEDMESVTEEGSINIRA